MGQTILDEREFARISGEMLVRIEQGIDAAALDVEAYFPGAGLLEIEFDDGSQMIINRHEPSREIWVAAKSGAHHFRWEGDRWLDTRSGEELLTAVSRILSAATGQAVQLR